ncbi:MAG: hypothetical protein HOP21_08935 [Methylotenera sp.]|nr:hypothetical protein [Methylotenera sp.]
MKLFDNVEKNAEDHPSFIDRLLTAILAPIAFNFSIITMVAMLSVPRGPVLFNPYKWFYQVSPNFFIYTTIVLPGIAGFLMGMSRFTTLFGHFFYTNMGDEKDVRKTIAAWVCLFLIAYCIAGALA